MPAEGSQRERDDSPAERSAASRRVCELRSDQVLPEAASDGRAGSGLNMSSDSAFQIELNGEPHIVRGDARLIALIESLKLRRGRVAVEINRAVLPKAEWDAAVLKPGDTVEIVNFVGGG
jgi:thiamine biosynthesis protein ThiS